MWASWIQQYGYLALFVGAMLEGEAVLILAGYSVAQGYLSAFPAFVLAVASGMTADSVYFWLGRRFGAGLLRNRPSLRPLRLRATVFVRKRGRAAAFLTRFAYGLRIVVPILLGSIRMRPSTFHPFDALGAFCFAALYLAVGFLFGRSITEMASRVESWETVVIVGVLLLGLVVWGVREWRIYRSAPR